MGSEMCIRDRYRSAVARRGSHAASGILQTFLQDLLGHVPGHPRGCNTNPSGAPVGCQLSPERWGVCREMAALSSGCSHRLDPSPTLAVNG